MRGMSHEAHLQMMCVSLLGCVVACNEAGTTAVMSLRDKLVRIEACRFAGLEECLQFLQAIFDSVVTKDALSELYDYCTELLSSSNVSQAVTAAAAALLFLSTGTYSELVLKQYVQHVFLPLAVAIDGQPVSIQLLHQLTLVLVSNQAWQIVIDILQCVHDALAESGCHKREPTTANSLSIAGRHQLQHVSLTRVSVQLPASTACTALQEITAAVSHHVAQQGQQSKQVCQTLQEILSYSTGQLFSCSCNLLSSPNTALRQAAFQQLLPALLHVAESSSSSIHAALLQQLWLQCLQMVSQGGLPRRMGLSVLLQYWSAWPVQPPTAADAEDHRTASMTELEPNSRGAFWGLLRDCLVDSEALNRKRAFRLLQLLLPEALLQQQPVWGVFLALYELLDEFSPHLVKASWPMISQLHPVSPDFKSLDAETDVAISGQMNLLKITSADQQQQQQLEQDSNGSVTLAFCWTSVIWTLALQHKNLQVQRMCMKTLLKRDWTPDILCQVPASFITLVLLPALLSPVHHRTTAAAGLTATGGVVDATSQQQQQVSAMTTAHPVGPGNSGVAGFDVVREAAGLVSRYVAAAGGAAADAVLSGGLRLLSTPGTDLPRSGLLAVLRVLAAAATTAMDEGVLFRGVAEGQTATAAKEALSMLQALLGRLVTYAGQRFRINCYNLLLTIAAAAVPVGSCDTNTVARLLQGMPAWMMHTGGPLQDKVSAWLLTDSSHTLSGMKTMWQQYFNSSSSSGSRNADQTGSYQEWHAEVKDYAAWRSSCDAWLRVVMSSEQLQQYLKAAAAELVDRTGQLPSRSYWTPGTPEKTLVMLTCLFDSAEAAGRVAAEAGQPVPAQSQIALQAAAMVAEPLSACVASYCCCYRAKPALASSNGSHTDSGISRRACAAAARAHEAVQAASAAVGLLARGAADNWSADSSSGVAAHDAAAACNKHLMPSLLLLVRRLCEVAEQLSGGPLPAAVQGDWQAAVAVEQSRASALKVLCESALGICRALLCCPSLCLSTLQLTPGNWVTAVLRETATAKAARGHWLAAASRDSSATGQSLSGWIEDMNWKCLDAVEMLMAITHKNITSNTTASRACYTLSSVAPGDAASSKLSGAGDPFQLPSGVLSAAAVTDVFAQGLEALQWTASDHGSNLVELLRCLRRVWCLMVKDEQLQVSAQQFLEAAGVHFSKNDDSSLLCSLASALGNSLLGVLHSSKKRPQLMYSLVINTLLLPELCVFNAAVPPELAALHAAPDAPLRRFIQGLIQQGSKGSPRLMLALGLLLGSYVSESPQLLVWYAAELRQLWMFGVAAQVGAEELTLVLPSVEESFERQLLRDPLDPELQDAYTLTDIGPRVAVCCGLHQLAVQAGLLQRHNSSVVVHDSSSSSKAWVCDVEAAGVQLWQHWLQCTLTDPVLCGERFKVGSDIHRLKVRAWQGLTVAANFISSARQRDLAATVVQDLLVQLGVNNPPSIKQYQEAIIAHLLLQHTGLLEELLLPQFSSVEKGSTATGSHILIAVQVALHSQPEVQTHILPLLVKQLLPWTNHHTHNIRTFAQLGFCAIMDTKPLDVWEGWSRGLGPGGVDVLQNLLRFMHDNTDFQRFRKAMGTGILGWSPVGITSPRRIFSSALHLAGAEESPVTFEGVPETLMDKLITFLAAERAKLREAAVERVAGYESGPLPAADSNTGTGAAVASALANAGSGPATVADGFAGIKVDFQRKVTPHERAALMADVLDELDAAAAAGSGPAGTQRHELVVVASLICKVPNLGGLARTAEVLGAGALVLSDKRVAAEAGFTSVSVTAERWVPLIEVTEAALIPWLAKQKADGYTLVGLEQTAESTSLPNYTFPSRTVLVLGREKEGIPPEIIGMLDATVEIPQLGVIRSLNVHVSGAIAMYEYVKQRR